MRKPPIKHKAVVSKISEDSIQASIAITTACDGCHAKSSCGMTDNKTRLIDIPYTGDQLNLGDHIQITGDASIGNRAVFYAYILPFLIVMLVLILSLSVLHTTETEAGSYSLLSLPIYYLALFLFKKTFSKKYTFRINS